MDSAFNYLCNLCGEEIELTFGKNPPIQMRCPECGYFDMYREEILEPTYEGIRNG